MPGSLIEGSWHSGGYYGHDRSRTYTEQAQKYRRLAAPTPPVLFNKRSQLPISKHAFSEHDTRKSLSCGPIYFEHSIGRRRQSILQPDDRRQRDFLTWMPDKTDDKNDPVNKSLSSYTVDYRGVQVDLPRMNQRLVQHLRDSIEEDKRLPVSTYMHVHCSPYPELLDVSKLSTTRDKNIKRFHDIAVTNGNVLTNSTPNNATDSSLTSRRWSNRSKAATSRESVARCLVWYQPPSTKQAETQTGTMCEKSQHFDLNKKLRIENLYGNDESSSYCEREVEKIDPAATADQDIPVIIGL